MQRFVIVTVAVIIGVIASQLFFSDKPSSPASEPQIVEQENHAPQEQPANNETLSTQAANPFAELISKSADGAEVFIIEPVDGAQVTSPLTVKFGIKNMVLAKAGEDVESSGHHHLLIDLQELPNLSAPLPATDQLIHFGGAQTETTIELEPGEHTLQLLLGNYLHIPHDEPVLSEKITINVQ